MKANIENMRCGGDSVVKARKEHAFDSQISVIDPKTGRELVIARIYWPGQTVYACIWIHGRITGGTGGGRAGGGGYHKPSAALSSAIAAAGVTLSEPIDGRGDSAMIDACEAIARAVTGKRKVYSIRAHP